MLQWQYFTSLNGFFSIIFVIPVLSKTYSTILDSSLLKMEGEVLNKKKKDYSQTTCSSDELSFVDEQHFNTD